VSICFPDRWAGNAEVNPPGRIVRTPLIEDRWFQISDMPVSQQLAEEL